MMLTVSPMTVEVNPGPRTIFITVDVTDINDNRPIFPNRQLAIQFSEIAPPSAVN